MYSITVMVVPLLVTGYVKLGLISLSRPGCTEPRSKAQASIHSQSIKAHSRYHATVIIWRGRFAQLVVLICPGLKVAAALCEAIGINRILAEPLHLCR